MVPDIIQAGILQKFNQAGIGKFVNTAISATPKVIGIVSIKPSVNAMMNLFDPTFVAIGPTIFLNLFEIYRRNSFLQPPNFFLRLSRLLSAFLMRFHYITLLILLIDHLPLISVLFNIDSTLCSSRSVLLRIKSVQFLLVLQIHLYNFPSSLQFPVAVTEMVLLQSFKSTIK